MDALSDRAKIILTRRANQPHNCIIALGPLAGDIAAGPKSAIRTQAAQRGDLYSITSSASAIKVAGISKPSVRAVRTLMDISNLVGACTGKSAGFSPFRMRLT